MMVSAGPDGSIHTEQFVIDLSPWCSIPSLEASLIIEDVPPVAPGRTRHVAIQPISIRYRNPQTGEVSTGKFKFHTGKVRIPFDVKTEMLNPETQQMKPLPTPTVSFHFEDQSSPAKAIMDAFDAWLIDFVAKNNPTKPNGTSRYFTPSKSAEVQAEKAKEAVRTAGYVSLDPETHEPKVSTFTGLPFNPTYTTRFWRDNNGRTIFVRPDAQTPIETSDALAKGNHVCLTLSLDGIKYSESNVSLAWTIQNGMVTEFAQQAQQSFIPSFYAQFAQSAPKTPVDLSASTADFSDPAYDGSMA